METKALVCERRFSVERCFVAVGGAPNRMSVDATSR
jgi:hypothetical protein